MRFQYINIIIIIIHVNADGTTFAIKTQHPNISSVSSTCINMTMYFHIIVAVSDGTLIRYKKYTLKQMPIFY